MDELDQKLRVELVLFALAVARLIGVVIVSPIPWEKAPRLVKSGLVIFLALLVHGHGKSDIPGLTDMPMIVILSIGEFIAGVAIGLVVRMLIGIAEITGSVLAPAMGFGAGQMFDPAVGEPDTTLSRLYRLLAIMLALIVGLHRVLLSSLIMSFSAVPVGSLRFPELSTPILLHLSTQIIATGTRLALPVLAVLLIMQVALAFISRAAPAMQIFHVGFALLLVVGGFVLLLSLPDFGREFLIEASRLEGQIESLLRVMSGR